MKHFIDLIINLEKFVRSLNGTNTIYFTQSVTSVDEIRRLIAATKYWNSTSDLGKVTIQFGLTSMNPAEYGESFNEYCRSMKMSELTDLSRLDDLEDDEYSRIILALS